MEKHWVAIGVLTGLGSIAGIIWMAAGHSLEPPFSFLFLIALFLGIIAGARIIAPILGE